MNEERYEKGRHLAAEHAKILADGFGLSLMERTRLEGAFFCGYAEGCADRHAEADYQTAFKYRSALQKISQDAKTLGGEWAEQHARGILLYMGDRP